MKVLIQRSKNSCVKVKGDVVGQIPFGLVVFLGITYSDDEKDIDYLVNKIVSLRIFDDEKGVMNKSILDTSGKVLLISQFTLMADTKKGNRPSYVNAAKKDIAKPLYERFIQKLENHVQVQTGIFGEEMLVNINNDGPITIMIDSKNK